MRGQLFQHVVEEPNAGVDGNALGIQVEIDTDVGFIGCAVDGPRARLAHQPIGDVLPAFAVGTTAQAADAHVACQFQVGFPVTDHPCALRPTDVDWLDAKSDTVDSGLTLDSAEFRQQGTMLSLCE